MGWIAGRQYRQQITIQEGNVFDDHIDFPVAIKISGSNDVFTNAQADGYDILFANDAEEILSYERVRWDPGSQILFVYVKTDLSSTEATTFYMYYGNGGNTITVDGQNKFGTWNSNFRAVYHFEEASGQLQDSTSNARHSTSNNQVKYHYDGLFSYACYFDGSDDYFTFNTGTTLVRTGNLARSITAYFYPMADYTEMADWESLIRWSGVNNSIARQYILSLQNPSAECSSTQSIGIGYWGSNTCTGERVVSSGDEILTNTWHQYAGTHNDSNSQKVFLNGTQRGTSSYTLDTVDGDVLIGKRETESQSYHGRLSEIRLYNIDVGNDWIRTEYENMINNSSFFTLGAEEDTPYLLTDVPTVLSIVEGDGATRNILTEFELTSTATIYDDWPTEVSLADFATTISGLRDIDVELVTSFSGILSDAELNNQVEFITSASGILISTVRDTINDFTVAKQPVPITDPYGGTDVAVDYIQGHIVTPSGYGLDVDNEFVVGNVFSTTDDQDVDFSIATFEIFGYYTESFASTYSGTAVYDNMGWYDFDWAYRTTITVNHLLVPGDLTGFPLTVQIDTAHPVFTNSQNSGNDILFTDSVGTKLDHELSVFSKSNNLLVAYIKADISSVSDTVIYMYYGNTAAPDQSNPTAVWTGYRGVYHFEDTDTNTLTDSTSNSRDGYAVAGITAQTDGIIGKSWEFRGNSGDYVNIPQSEGLAVVGGGARSVSCYFYPLEDENDTPSWAALVRLGGDGSFDRLFLLSVDNPEAYPYCNSHTPPDNQIAFHGYGGGSNVCTGYRLSDIGINDWHSNAVTYGYSASNNIQVFLNGTAYGNRDVTLNTYDDDVHLGSRGTTETFKFRFCELRVYNGALSPNWIETEHNNIIEMDSFLSFEDEELEYHWELDNYIVTETTISGGRIWPIETNVHASVSGTNFYDTDLYVSLANTISGTLYGSELLPLISGSYFSSEVTISGALGYPVYTDVYVSLANSFSGQVPIPPSANHTSDYTVISGSYFNTDMRLHALQIDNFFLDIDEYTDATDTMSVDITDLRFIEIDTNDSYFIINGVPVTSGIVFDPVSRPTASGFTMSYDPPADFFAEEPIEVIVHAENVIDDVLEETFYLLYGYNLVVDKPGVSYGWDKDVVIWSTATNTASCPASSTDGWTVRTASQPYKDLGATIVPQVKHADLSAVIYPISTAIFYGNRYKITVRAKDLAGNEMPPFILDLTIEDKPN